MKYNTATEAMMAFKQAEGKERIKTFIDYCEHVRDSMDDIISSFEMLQKMEKDINTKIRLTP